MPGGTLFNRDWSITLGDREVTNLRCEFKIKKNLKPEPNTCELAIYNLSEDTRKSLESKKVLTCRVEAGYKETGVSQLYLGQIRSAHSHKDGPDVITEVSTGDSEKEIRESKIHLSIGPGVPPAVALTAIARSLGVGPGNVAAATALLATKGVANMFGVASAISGNTARELTDFCRSAGLEWSVQDGKLQILDRNRPMLGKAVLISPSTGLVGSPTVDGKGIVLAKCLIIPELTPGRLVVFQSKGVTGGYRIQEVEYQGDTHGDTWYANLHCKKF